MLQTHQLPSGRLSEVLGKPEDFGYFDLITQTICSQTV